MTIALRKHSAACGSIVVLTLAFLLAMTLQVLLMGTIVTRTLSLESSNSSQSVTAKEAADTGIERLHQALITYNAANTLTSTSAMATFGSGQAQAITNASISVTNPETGLSASTPVTISAYVGQARGDMYELISTATYRDTVITSRKWIQLTACVGGLAAPTILQTGGGSGSDAYIRHYVVDEVNNRIVIGNNNRGTVLYRDGTLLTTLLGGVGNAFSRAALDKTTGVMLIENYYTDPYVLKADNSLVSIPSLTSTNGAHGGYAINPSTGEIYTYRYTGTANTRGLWKYNPTTATATQLATFTLSMTAYNPELIMNPNDGRIFILPCYYDGTNAPTTKVYTWAQATGLTSFAPTNYACDNFALNTNNSQIFFGDAFTSGLANLRLYAWSPGGGLITINNTNSIGYYGLSIDLSRNALMFLRNAANFHLQRWMSGTLTTLASYPYWNTSYQYGIASIMDATTGNYFFPSSATTLRMYNPATDTIITLPPASIYADSYNVRPFQAHNLNNSAKGIDRVMVNDVPSVTGISGAWISSPNVLYLWTPANGIQTILSLPSGSPGYSTIGARITPNPANGDTFIATDSASDYFYKYSNSQLLSLVASGDNDEQSDNPSTVNFTTGRVYFEKGSGATMQTIYTSLTTVGSCD